MAKSFEAQLNDILEDFHEVVKDNYEGAAKDVAEECVVRLKAVKWKTDTGKRYSSTWKLKHTKKGGGHLGYYVVHNSKNYRLTHLLENGHITVNAKGRQKRDTPAHPHIYPVYEWAQGELEREIRQRIERASWGG